MIYKSGFALFFLSTFVSASLYALEPFTSDGCSLFPDSNVITKVDWCECCLQHDIAYWKGGTEKQRAEADLKLRQCVERKTQDATLAKIMYDGVRFGGSPYFYNWYRWGYGWDYSRKYQPLTEAENQKAEMLLKQFWQSPSQKVCKAIEH